MTKQEQSALNVAKFIRGQTLLLLEKLNELDLDRQADLCEKLHENSEALYQALADELERAEKNAQNVI